jgi:hypothetical protein
MRFIFEWNSSTLYRNANDFSNVLMGGFSYSSGTFGYRLATTREHEPNLSYCESLSGARATPFGT